MKLILRYLVSFKQMRVDAVDYWKVYIFGKSFKQ